MELKKQVCSLELAKRLKELENVTRWKAVVGYEGKYEVSDNGLVRSIGRSGTPGKVLKQHDDRGYRKVFLSLANKVRARSVHRIVAQSFIENPGGCAIVNHKNGNKADNSVMNLEWCTREYNEAHKKGVLGHDGKGSKNANYGYRHAKLYPSPALRNRLCELGVPRYRHNLAELGEMLPMGTKFEKYSCKGKPRFCVIEVESIANMSIHDHNEADARARMYIYLIEQGLVKP